MPISTPSQITVPFATSGLKNAIPSTSNPVTGNAGYDAGFPATNMTPKEAGGIPPFGQDFNGILFDITTAIRYLEAGMQFPYSSSFATAVGGYPLGAIVTRTDGTGFWRNTVANNTTDPEAFGAGWSPEGSGISTVAMSNANVTLTALQAARPIIIIAGTLTANLNLIFPTYQRQWLIVNNAAGAFSVTCKTSGGSGVSVATGTRQSVYGDGTNIAASSSAPTQQGVVAQFSNLKSSATGLSSIVLITADEIMLQAAASVYLTVRAVNLSLNLAGSGANGIDTGTSAANTWYYLYVISNGTTTAALASLSSTAPTMPGGYTYKARVGSIRTDGTANKFPLSFSQAGRRIQWKLGPGSNLVALPSLAVGIQGSPTTPTWVSVSVSSATPPTATTIFVNAHMGSLGKGIIVAPNSNYGSYMSTTATPPIAISASTNMNMCASASMALESANIFYASDDTAGSAVCNGYEDSL